MNLEERIIDSIQKVKGKDIVIYDLKERSPFFDMIVVASCDSERQASAFLTYLKGHEDEGVIIKGVEGEDSPWVLVDLGSAIVSVFTPFERERIEIDKLYSDYPSKKIDD